MNKTLNVTYNSNLGTSISPIKKAIGNQEVEADSKIDDAIKIKEQQTNQNPLRQSDFTSVKIEPLTTVDAPHLRNDVSIV
jgi:hypothetical protein